MFFTQNSVPVRPKCRPRTLTNRTAMRVGPMTRNVFVPDTPMTDVSLLNLSALVLCISLQFVPPMHLWSISSTKNTNRAWPHTLSEYSHRALTRYLHVCNWVYVILCNSLSLHLTNIALSLSLRPPLSLALSQNGPLNLRWSNLGVLSNSSLDNWFLLPQKSKHFITSTAKRLLIFEYILCETTYFSSFTILVRPMTAVRIIFCSESCYYTPTQHISGLLNKTYGSALNLDLKTITLNASLSLITWLSPMRARTDQFIRLIVHRKFSRGWLSAKHFFAYR